MSGNVSQHSIAKSLGISVATVNRSLGDHKGTNPVTRARVLQAASSMGYRFEKIRNDTGEPSENLQIGVLMLSKEKSKAYENQVSFRVLAGITSEAKLLDLSVSIDYIKPEEPDAINMPSMQPSGLKNGLWKGAILSGHYPAETVSKFASERIAVQVADYIPGVAIDCIDHDDMASCEMLVEHLWRLGHRKIGFFALGGKSPCFFSRSAGFMMALMRRGVPDAQARILAQMPGEMPDAAISRAVKKTQEGVEAWICVDDYNGHALSSALLKNGMRCPADVSLCGFDNFEAPAGLPKLTSIDAPFEEMGAAALRHLVAKIKRCAPDRLHIMLNARLVDGESTGPAKR